MTPNFLDMFHGDNHEAMPDFASIKANDGILGIAHKATQGTDYVDPHFIDRIRAASKAGLAVMAYHFGSNTSVQLQLQHFNSVCDVANIPNLWKALDYENNKRQTMSSWLAVNFLARMSAPVVYGSGLVKQFATQLFNANPKDGVWLWLAEYGPVEKIPFPWQKSNTIGWQYSESGSIKYVNGHVDLNVFDPAVFNQWGKPCSMGSSKTRLPT